MGMSVLGKGLVMILVESVTVEAGLSARAAVEARHTAAVELRCCRNLLNATLAIIYALLDAPSLTWAINLEASKRLYSYLKAYSQYIRFSCLGRINQNRMIAGFANAGCGWHV